MIVKGRCRGNGPQLANYLLKSPDNDRSQVIAILGTATPHSLRKSLLEMSLTSEIKGNTKAGLYHAQISPRDHEAATMTTEQKLRAVEILAEHLGLKGQKCAIVEHEKDGRIHLHATWERYNHKTGNMWKDDDNYAKHKTAARQMELEFGHELTHEKSTHLDKYAKAYISNIWENSPDAASFKKALLEKAGFELVQGIDRRPFKIIDQFGKLHDLSRQLKGIKQAQVSDRLNPIRKELRTETAAVKSPIKQQVKEALRRNKRRETTTVPKLDFDKIREMSDSQDLMVKMKNAYKERNEPKDDPPKTYSYSFKIQHPPSLPYKPEPEIQSDKKQELSDRQELAVAMIKQYQSQQLDKIKASEPMNENDPFAAYRYSKENDLLAEYRSQKKEQTRPKERNRERGIDIE
ncbi:relaxase/mobilization nuclease domain-containing protein [Larkinella humicola]|uniref:Relaxase/mobilization nuclease domain-containing protein n=1 Tax=Larkinella humicola TaxID=2607654 RepID=A0A5N1J1P6_9BACT|nr:relaxase/mobilization nuclease domain-containing protein [Larkinella humicola]KAA9340344.1 relaxase/mobilization nuclease domain-containing protein [Larkinella humicola]